MIIPAVGGFVLTDNGRRRDKLRILIPQIHTVVQNNLIDLYGNLVSGSARRKRCYRQNGENHQHCQ